MEIRQLQSLVALAEVHTIANVAERLHLSAAAIHKQLKVLEEELGIRFYQKIGRNLELTQAAAVLLPYAKDLLAQHEAAIAAMNEWKGLKRGFVRVGAGPTLSSYFLPQLLMTYRELFPFLDLFVETGSSIALLENLNRGSVDLVLLISSVLPGEIGLRVEGSWDAEFVLVTNLSSVPRHCFVRDLSGFPFILYRKGSRIQDHIDQYFAGIGFRPNVVMTFDNAEAVKAMIRAGLGIGMLPLWTVDKELQEGALSMVRQRDRPLISQINLVTKKSTFTPPPVGAFIKVARNHKFKTPRLISSGHRNE